MIQRDTLSLDILLFEFAAGTLSEVEHLLVATHLALCPSSSDQVCQYEEIGGTMLEEMAPSSVSEQCLTHIMDHIECCDPEMPCKKENQPCPCPSGLIPPPISPLLHQQCFEEIHWQKVFKGLQKFDLPIASCGGRTLRITRVAPGLETPCHHHLGTEITLILEGGYEDELGHYGRGDISIIDDENISHTPAACCTEGCIALTITDAPVQFDHQLVRFMNLFRRF